MSLTLVDLKEKLKQLDEISLLEVLNIDSEMLVERFEDLIEERFDRLEEEFLDEEEETNSYY